MSDLSTELLISNNKAIENLTNISSKLVFIVDKLYENSPNKNDIKVINDIRDSVAEINNTLVLLKANNVDVNLFKTETLNLKVLLEDLAKVLKSIDINRNYEKIRDVANMLEVSKEKNTEFIVRFSNVSKEIVDSINDINNILKSKDIYKELQEMKIEINRYNNYIERRKENLKSETEVNRWLYQIIHELNVNKKEITGKDIANSIDSMIHLSELLKKFHTYRYVIFTAIGLLFTFLTFKESIKSFLTHLLKIVG